jgi:predicted metal-dependent peptidase
MTFLGRGGTDFAPIMQMVEERHYKSVVILTDGEAGAVPQPSAEVVWVLPAGHNPPVDWGKRIHMERHI